MGAGLGMMSTQASIEQAAGPAGPFATQAAVLDAADRTQMASYGWYGYNSNWRR
jgi:hypothetical protein